MEKMVGSLEMMVKYFGYLEEIDRLFSKSGDNGKIQE